MVEPGVVWAWLRPLRTRRWLLFTLSMPGWGALLALRCLLLASGDDGVLATGLALAQSAPDATWARSLFVSRGCGACHTVEELPSARGLFGPDLTWIGTLAGTRLPGMSAPGYIRESILQPNAFITPGHEEGTMLAYQLTTEVPPPFGYAFTSEELETLVAYLAQLGTPAPLERP